MTNVFEGCLASGEIAELLGDVSIVQAMLDFEAALARAKATVGIVSAAASNTIEQTCKAELFDIAKIVRDGGRAGCLAIPLVRALRDNVALFNPEAAAHVHAGASSQDVINTAMVLVTRRALALVESDLSRAVNAIVGHGHAHAATPMLAREPAQAPSMTTFGWKCASWAQALLNCRGRVAASKDAALTLHFGLSATTFGLLGAHTDAIARRMAGDLGIAPSPPRSRQREAWIGLAADLGLLVATAGSIAQEISVRAQLEAGELAEASVAGAGEEQAALARNSGALSIAHAAAIRVPHRIACLLSATAQHDEPGYGGWQAAMAEWPSLLISVQGASQALASALEGLQVVPARMRANLEATRGLVFAESATAVLAAMIGPGDATELVQGLCRELAGNAQRNLREDLLKVVKRRAGLRGRVDTARLRHVFDVDSAAGRLATRTLRQLEGIAPLAGARRGKTKSLRGTGERKRSRRDTASVD